MKIEKRVIVKNEQGLHARPAALFVQTANKFKSEVSVSKDDQEVNGKSIMGIMMLAAGKGSIVILRVEGPDAKEAVNALEIIISGDVGL